MKRFHSYGLGESHVDQLLQGVEELVPDGSAKLGFRAHYPQIETKLTVRGADEDDIERKLGPVVAEVRKRLGNFIMAEDDDTLEGVDPEGACATAAGRWRSSRPSPAARSPRASRHLPGAETVFRRGIVARDPAELWDALRLATPVEITRETAEAVAQAARRDSGASHALAVLIDLDDGPDRIDFGGTICIAIATETDARTRAARAFSAGANGCGSAPSNSASTACAASSTGCRSPSASISSGPDIPVSLCTTYKNRLILRHPGEGGIHLATASVAEPWIPAFAGMTITSEINPAHAITR